MVQLQLMLHLQHHSSFMESVINNYVNVESSVSEISVENNIQTFFLLGLILCVICTFQDRMRCIFFNQSFYYFLEKQERIKLLSVWVTMGMW